MFTTGTDPDRAEMQRHIDQLTAALAAGKIPPDLHASILFAIDGLKGHVCSICGEALQKGCWCNADDYET